MWRLWAKALGEKAHRKDQVADKVAIIRTIIFATYLITNSFIVAGVIKHWNDKNQETCIKFNKSSYDKIIFLETNITYET